MELSATEREFVDEARGRIRDHARKRRAAGHVDKLYAFVRSETGTVYEGTPLETSMTQADCCAERHAIANISTRRPSRRCWMGFWSPAPSRTPTTA